MELLGPDDPWAAYARTVVVIVRTDTANLVVEGAPAGETGSWPWPSDDPVHVLTAWDPGEVRRSEEENRALQAALEAEVRQLGPHELWDAVGVDLVSGHREEGLAARGLRLDAVLEAASRYGQDAVFEWTPSAWAIVACRGDRRAEFGWTVTPD